MLGVKLMNMHADLELLMDKIRKEKQLFVKMQVISRRQVELLQNSREDIEAINKFVALIDERQGLMDKIDLLSRQRTAIETEFGEDIMGQEQYRDYQGERAVICSIIKSIQGNDSKCNELAREIMEQTGDKLANTRNNRKAVKAYLNPDMYSEACFFDRKK